MKRILCGAVCLLLCGCGGRQPDAPPAAVAASVQTEADRRAEAVRAEAARWAALYADEPAAVRALLAHDRICRNCSYQADAPERHSAYGAMLCGEAVCDGYAAAFAAMMQAADIPVRTVTGTARTDGQEIPHAWNLAELDGHWYHIDCTWDDGDPPAHTFFLCTDAMMQETHSWDASAYPSAAGGTMRYETVAAEMLQNQKTRCRTGAF